MTDLCGQFNNKQVEVKLDVSDTTRCIVIKIPKLVEELEFFAIRAGIKYEITEFLSGIVIITIAKSDMTPFTLRYGL